MSQVSVTRCDACHRRSCSHGLPEIFPLVRSYALVTAPGLPIRSVIRGQAGLFSHGPIVSHLRPAVPFPTPPKRTPLPCCVPSRTPTRSVQPQRTRLRSRHGGAAVPVSVGGAGRTELPGRDVAGPAILFAFRSPLRSKRERRLATAQQSCVRCSTLASDPTQQFAARRVGLEVQIREVTLEQRLSARTRRIRLAQLPARCSLWLPLYHRPVRGDRRYMPSDQPT